MKPQTRYEEVQNQLRARPRRWLVTGCAGFIGSHLLEKLLQLDQAVVGLDNFATGKRSNLEEVRTLVSDQQWARFSFQEGDILRLEDCQSACIGVEYILHQAALGSVPRSIEDPLRSHSNNVDGTINLLQSARTAGVRKFVYASSSSVYGDHPALPKIEERLGSPLSPYAATKRICEIYAETFGRVYGLPTIGLRYFNVFGPRQDPAGPYAAVIPKWFSMLTSGVQPSINGDGETSRDFCFVGNVVQANLLSIQESAGQVSRIYNVGCGEKTSLNSLLQIIHKAIGLYAPILSPTYKPQRDGDVRHSLADISAIKAELGYGNLISLAEGIGHCSGWYCRR